MSSSSREAASLAVMYRKEGVAREVVLVEAVDSAVYAEGSRDIMAPALLGTSEGAPSLPVDDDDWPRRAKRSIRGAAVPVGGEEEEDMSLAAAAAEMARW